jgi:hypothetical protein
MSSFTQQDNIRAWWSIIRDILAFFAGTAVIAYETAWASADRPWLLIIAIGMMGIPFASKADDWIAGRIPKKDDSKDSEEH